MTNAEPNVKLNAKFEGVIVVSTCHGFCMALHYLQKHHLSDEDVVLMLGKLQSIAEHKDMTAATKFLEEHDIT